MDYLIGKIVLIALLGMAFWAWEKSKKEQRDQIDKMTKVLEAGTLSELDDDRFHLFWLFAIDNLTPKSEHWDSIHNERSRRSVRSSDKGEDN